MVVTGTAFGSHDMAWLRRQARPSVGAAVRVDDVTGQRSSRTRCGVRAAATILRAVTGADLSNDAFPFMTAQEIAVGDVPVRALRVTFTGELGLGALRAGGVRRSRSGQTLWAAGRSTVWSPAATAPSRACGWRRATGCGAPTSPRRPTPTRRASGFCVKLDKPGGFEGREALRSVKEAGADPAAALPDAGRPAGGRAGQRAGAHRRRGGAAA